jgi:hypothetical protein
VSGLKVAKGSIKCVLMVGARHGHMPFQSGNGVGKIGAGFQHGVHEGTNCMLVLLYIDFGCFELCEVLICRVGVLIG